MTLKEELELLRGEPIKLRTPVEQVPCNETSDAERLCRNPVVSVYMVTYNHEPYIAQAIEGVVMQQTDFEFEVVIGEDASQDRTREICFEYQKRYPDKIRVLWSEENVTRPYGGNGPRVMARCRGEFIAFCEGDDYWTDPLKLQKQVEVMRANPSVGLCFAGAQVSFLKGDFYDWEGDKVFSNGLLPGMTFFRWHLFGKHPKKYFGPETFIMTATVLIRRATLRQAQGRYDILTWRLFLGDAPLWLALSSLSDVYFVADKVSVYRRHLGGICFTAGDMVACDACLTRLYYARKVLGCHIGQFDFPLWSGMMTSILSALAKRKQYIQQRAYIMLRCSAEWKKAYFRSRYMLPLFLLKRGVLTPEKYVWVLRYLAFCHSPWYLVGATWRVMRRFTCKQKTLSGRA